MNVLFIHQNFPGQFVHLSADLAHNPAHRVLALSLYDNPSPPGVQIQRYKLLREPAKETHPLLLDLEAKVLRAEACAAAAMRLKQDGFYPDLIVAHPGWGEALFMKDVFPNARLAIYCEYYYAMEGQDVGFDPEMPQLTLAQQYMLRMRNTTHLLSLEAADLAFAPTQWQKQTFPAWAQERIAVIHDGIDTQRLQHRPHASLTLESGHAQQPVRLGVGDEILTYVARNLEPVRGFHIFMRALPEVLTRRPKTHVIVVGGDDVSYGSRAPRTESWREQLMQELNDQIDLSRVHFVGRVPDEVYLDLLSISKMHVYLTTPFVLSWSFLEAALAGVPMVASATQPVLEFSGRLGVQTADFFDVKGFADAIIQGLAAPRKPRKAKSLKGLSVAECVAAQKAFLEIR